MPIAALLTCVLRRPDRQARGSSSTEVKLSSHVQAPRRPGRSCIKYVAPVLLVVILVAYVAAQFGLFSM